MEAEDGTLCTSGPVWLCWSSELPSAAGRPRHQGDRIAPRRERDKPEKSSSGSGPGVVHRAFGARCAWYTGVAVGCLDARQAVVAWHRRRSPVER
ncbi:hypothetical protein NDU88_003414 [Pleurodeles waltl]|uniref:Uncharacterized protein n=1 Tax=Pleurodeles waltl TaxID=8319 RepID=A0AAV7RE85_PLEWA|nr:hypothetical protein NDU88_003414 [Pleurodeles waltl]